jgi:hypothetical protein
MMNVTFTRNNRQYQVTPTVGGALLTQALAALCDARDGQDLAKSPAYLELQQLLTTHVYQPNAPKATKDQTIYMWFEEASAFNQRQLDKLAAHAENSGSASIFSLSGRNRGKSVATLMLECRRAYNSMILNMTPFAAIQRLSERFGVSSQVIKEWVR